MVSFGIRQAATVPESMTVGQPILLHASLGLDNDSAQKTTVFCEKKRSGIFRREGKNRAKRSFRSDYFR